MKPLVSVLVPVYNGECTIKKCVDSIINQSYSNIEIIIVNDGSTDNTYSLLTDNYSANGTIKIVNQQNGGATRAREIAVCNASGDYVYFTDADDTLAFDAIESMVALLEPDIDILVFETGLDGYFTTADYFRELLKYKSWYLWGKIIKRSLVKPDIFCIDRKIISGEDFLTQLGLLKYVRGRIVARSINKYNYDMYSPNSIRKFQPQTYEYEKAVVNEAYLRVSGLTKFNKDLFADFIRWEIGYVAGMMGLRYEIDYHDDFISRLKRDVNDMDMILGFKDRLAMKALDKPCLRWYFRLEKLLRKIVRKAIDLPKTGINCK